MNYTPIVRQYGILLMNGCCFYAKKDTKKKIHRRVQTRSCRDDDARKTKLPGKQLVSLRSMIMTVYGIGSASIWKKPQGLYIERRGRGRGVLRRSSRRRLKKTCWQKFTTVESGECIPKKIECLGREGTARESKKVIWELRHEHKLSLLLDVAGPLAAHIITTPRSRKSQRSMRS